MKADYIYNPETKLFISYDSPHSVRDKGNYVQQKNLGGMLTCIIDNDNGVLVNAVLKGFGNTLITQIVGIKPFYFFGINQQNLSTQDIIFEPKPIVDNRTTQVMEL